jgi:transposase-like protein
MVFTQHLCAHCGSEQIMRNGSKGGRAKYKCKACLRQGYFEPASVRKALLMAQVDALLLERNSQRSIARVTGIARMTIAKHLKKSPDPRA